MQVKHYTVAGFPQRLHGLIYKDYEHTCNSLANACGVHRHTIYRWLNGEATPNVVVLKRICDYFNCSADWLIYGVEK